MLLTWKKKKLLYLLVPGFIALLFVLGFTFPVSIPAVDIDGQNKWGPGMAVESHEGHVTYWHSGINPGFQSLFVLYPGQDRFIIVLTNSDNGLSFSQDVAREYLNVDDSWEIPRM